MPNLDPLDTLTAAAKEREFQRTASELNPQKGEDNYEFQFGNQKLTYDNYLEILTAQARRSQDHYDSLVTGERSHRAELERVSLQALQNAVETANMISKQAVRHTDLAIDRQWNREPAEALAEGAEMRELISQPAIAALQAAIVQAVIDGVKSVKGI